MSNLEQGSDVSERRQPRGIPLVVETDESTRNAAGSTVFMRRGYSVFDDVSNPNTWSTGGSGLSLTAETSLRDMLKWDEINGSWAAKFKAKMGRSVPVDPIDLDVSHPWEDLYASAFGGAHSSISPNASWKRIGCFYLKSPSVVLLAERMSVPNILPILTPEHGGHCSLTNPRSGIWIADVHTVASDVHTAVGRNSRGAPTAAVGCIRGPSDSILSILSEETTYILEARHVDLFLESGYKNGIWQYETVSKEVFPVASFVSASCGIVDMAHFNPSDLLDESYWVGPIGEPIAKACAHAVAVNITVKPDKGLRVHYQVMRDDEGKAVSTRISLAPFQV
ncbi:hypothetical protein LUZ63_003468 [Rhynchospora breviuscula]|uniref:Uncharacterized protein n=1 Tax=Rhynchospora breviuscula TaxID=2022672 RepID=A0A9Q0D0S4_9POAL|nr:hypothetical protein LUZ63_003468 [Rhynchospora breviuscula]